MDGQYEYSPKDYIGGGNFGMIYKCKKRYSKEKFVIKIIKKSKLEHLGEYGNKLL